jgi:hypothetical protein
VKLRLQPLLHEKKCNKIKQKKTNKALKLNQNTHIGHKLQLYNDILALLKNEFKKKTQFDH